MKRIVRNLSTDEGKQFWSMAEKAAAVVDEWPAWRKAGINVADLRTEARQVPEAQTSVIATKSGK
jgi:hypothetical protein